MDYESRMKLWIESAKSCSQLALAAMFLPVFWIREWGGAGKDKPLLGAADPSFVNCWIAFAVAVALSHTYQITAVKLIETGGKSTLFPRVQYWLMVVGLLAGIGFFIVGALKGNPPGSLPAQPAQTTPEQKPAAEQVLVPAGRLQLSATSRRPGAEGDKARPALL